MAIRRQAVMRPYKSSKVLWKLQAIWLRLNRILAGPLPPEAARHLRDARASIEKVIEAMRAKEEKNESD